MNMQHSAGAFDGWLWTIRHWCGVRRFIIEIGDDVVLPAANEPYSPHSGRLVFRIRMLIALLGKEVEIGNRLTSFIQQHPWRPDVTGWLNVSGSGRNRTFSGVFPLRSEDDWELALCQHPPFVAELAHAFNLAPRPSSPSGYALCRQFPVGVFDKDPRKKNWRLFCPKGKSAIDLIGVDRTGAVHIFELKKPGAIAVGALSELMFYACLLKEAKDGRLSFSAGNIDPNVRVFPHDIGQASAIRAHLFVPDIHPLLDAALLAEITALAQAQAWAFSIDAPSMATTVRSLLPHFRTKATSGR
ncbi:hypothetical protein [Mesorhizobium sp. CO1-1-11]|uniref:hypothetical protein n=1 Tax=Mesorhizobium sp. CO1-1-11 TaxID=2876636 RepID=UPI001CCC16FA|nr:hypothetical protein [Mesorhizobium sp. CO1-1-11]